MSKESSLVERTIREDGIQDVVNSMPGIYIGKT